MSANVPAVVSPILMLPTSFSFRKIIAFPFRVSRLPTDVLAMRLSPQPGDPHQPIGWFDAGQVFIMLDRGDYFQCALVIPKGGRNGCKLDH